MPDWYCKTDELASGPFSIEELRFLRDRGKLQSRDWVRCGKVGAWTNASAVPELFRPLRETTAARAPDSISAAGAKAAPRKALDASLAEDSEVSKQEQMLVEDLPRPGNVSTLDANLRVKQILVGSSIGTGVALLILLMIFLTLESGVGGSRGRLAGLGEGHKQGTATSDADGRESGRSRTPNENVSSGDEARGNVIAAGEFAKETLEESLEPVAEPEPDAVPSPVPGFSVHRIKAQSPEASTGSGAGGGGGLGDFKDRLDREGGKSGEVQFTLIWNNINDLDLHVFCPSGERIHYNHTRSACGGELDVDMNAGGRHSTEPVENVFWEDGSAPSGKYEVWIHHYANQGAPDPTAFDVAVKYDGKIHKFSGTLRHGQQAMVSKFQLR